MLDTTQVKVGGVGLCGRIEVVPALDNRVDDILEELEALLVTAREAHAQVGAPDLWPRIQNCRDREFRMRGHTSMRPRIRNCRDRADRS